MRSAVTQKADGRRVDWLNRRFQVHRRKSQNPDFDRPTSWANKRHKTDHSQGPYSWPLRSLKQAQGLPLDHVKHTVQRAKTSGTTTGRQKRASPCGNITVTSINSGSAEAVCHVEYHAAGCPIRVVP